MRTIILTLTLLGAGSYNFAQNPCEPLARGGFFNKSSQNLYRDVASSLTDVLRSSEFREYVRNRSTELSLNIILPTEAGPIPLGGSGANIDQQFEALNKAFARSTSISNRETIVNRISQDIEANGLVAAYVRCIELTQPKTGLRLTSTLLDESHIKLSVDYTSTVADRATIIADPTVFGIRGDLGDIKKGATIPDSKTRIIERLPNMVADITIETDKGRMSLTYPKPPEKYYGALAYPFKYRDNSTDEHAFPGVLRVASDATVAYLDANITLPLSQQMLNSVTIYSSRDQNSEVHGAAYNCTVASATEYGKRGTLANIGTVANYALTFSCNGQMEVRKDEFLRASYSFPTKVDYMRVEIVPLFINKGPKGQ